MRLRCGVDEAGRGPWAGPVVAAAVVFQGTPPAGLADSKTLSERKREALFRELTEGPHFCAVGFASAQEIDQINILQATFLAMQRAVAGLACDPALLDVWVDGNRKPRFAQVDDAQVQTLVKGDALMAEISAASVLAKVTRDRWMRELDIRCPGYDFAKHSGYGVPAHQAKLYELGPCEEHRRTFAPVKKCVQELSLRAAPQPLSTG